MSKRYEKSKALFRRASEVIPGGIYGHVSPAATVPGAFPYFAQQANGCRYQDVDGNEYIDYMCGYGPIILGYNHAEVNEAASTALAQGDCFNHPTEYSILLAEKLVSTIDGIDWAVFGKNGSDMTNWAMRVAREYTGRKRIAKVSHAYHGIDPWCVPGFGGLITEDRSQIDNFYWNDIDSLTRLITKYPQSHAAIFITPFHHPAFDDSGLPSADFIDAIHAICEEYGILLILDDVRCGFRLHPNGSHKTYGWKPDLICYSKALGNGYPISACTGRKAIKIAASKTFLTGSFWNASSPMAAALKTLEIIEREKVIQHLDKVGRQLVSGMLAIGKANNLELQASGPPALPYVRVANDPSFQQQQALCSAAAANGLFLHPHHNWFLCAAHTESIIQETLERFEKAVKGIHD